MSEPTLAQVFGPNATQDTTTVTISKADLAAVGLTASVANTPESLVAAIVLKTAVYLNPVTQETNTDIQITIEDSGYPQIVTRGTNNTRYRQTTYNVNFQTPDILYSLDPDNF